MYTPKHHKTTFTGKLRLPRDYTKEITFVGVIATFLGILVLSILFNYAFSFTQTEDLSTKKENTTEIESKKTNITFKESVIEIEEKGESNKFYLGNQVTKFQVISEFVQSKSTDSLCLTEKETMINIPTKDDIKCIEFDGIRNITTTIHIRMSAVQVKNDDVHLYTFLNLRLNNSDIDNNYLLYVTEDKVRYCDFSFPYDIIQSRQLNVVLNFEWNFNELDSLCFKGINLINSN